MQHNKWLLLPNYMAWWLGSKGKLYAHNFSLSGVSFIQTGCGNILWHAIASAVFETEKR